MVQVVVVVARKMKAEASTEAGKEKGDTTTRAEGSYPKMRTIARE